MKELVEQYINDEVDAIYLIRALSGAFNPDHAVDLLAIICMITRVEHGDLDKETFKSILFKEI